MLVFTAMKTDHPTWIPVPSPNMYPGRKPGVPVTGLVIHFTAAGSGKGTADYFSKKEVSWVDKGQTKTAKVSASSQIVIDRDGTVYQCTALEDRAWHAGPATKWKGQPLAKGQNANDFTVGIEIANWGKLSDGPPYKTYTGAAFKGQAFVAKDGSVWEAYPEKQIDAVIAAAKVIIAKYPAIKREDVQGHEQIQDNKNDPGPAFPWEKFLDGVFGDDDEETANVLNAFEDDDRKGHYDDEVEMCLVEKKA